MKDDVTKGTVDPRSFEERVFARFDAMDARFDATDARFDATDARFDKVDARLDKLEMRLDKVEGRLDGLATRVVTIEENIGARFGLVDVRLDKLEQLVDKRLLETRPIWESVQFELRRLNAKFEQYVEDLFEIRSDHRT